MELCLKCFTLKPEEAFHKDPHGKYGRRTRCKECRKNPKAKAIAWHHYTAPNTNRREDLWPEDLEFFDWASAKGAKIYVNDIEFKEMI